MGGSYKSGRESRDICMSEGSFTTLNIIQATVDNTTEKPLQCELCLSAMLFSTLTVESVTEVDESKHDPSDIDKWDSNLENAVETEGLWYAGGYLAHKFPQYQFLGSNGQIGDNTWIDIASRDQGKFIKPSGDFFKKFKIMENLFVITEKCNLSLEKEP